MFKHLILLLKITIQRQLLFKHAIKRFVFSDLSFKNGKYPPTYRYKVHNTVRQPGSIQTV